LEFISADQKPSLFNNTSTTGTYVKKGRKAKSVNENFAHSRQRYTIFTTASTGCTYSGAGTGDPPQVFLLFKGKKDGRILKEFAEMELPGWLHIQVQEFGSYREEDVIEALRKLLPVATSTRESMVVILDWFSAHRTPAVIEFVEGRGHVLLWHGGGCTPFTQINDTHLHAILARLLIRLENKVMHVERMDMHLNNRSGVASFRRADVVDVVMTAWRMVNHKAISEKGYEQTGPRLPLTAPIRREQVYKDLRPILDAIDPPIGLQEVGQKLRDDARAFVEAGFDSKWSKWEHCKRLIIEHDDEDDPLPEGLEMATFDYVDSESSHEADSEHGDADDADNVVDSDVDVAEDDDAGAAGVEAESAPDASQGAARVISVAEAREVLINQARKDRDDVSLKRLLSQRDEASASAKAAASATAIILQKVAFAGLVERKKQRQAAKDEQTKAKFDLTLSEQRKAEATERAHALKLQILEAESKAHDQKMAEAAAKESTRAKEQWLQVEYPRALAKHLIPRMPSTQAAAKVFVAMLKDLEQQSWFRFLPQMPSLWEVNAGLLIRHSSIAQLDNGIPRVVRCSPTFDAFLDEVTPIRIGVAKDALKSLKHLLERSAPGSSTIIFAGSRQLHRMLHLNDYVLDKTYVCCIVLISKWLSKKRFPDGIYEWPPSVPASLLPVSHYSSAAASSSSSSSLLPK
jgi:hypothetical protein